MRSFQDEFKIIEYLTSAHFISESRGIDAFALALLKVERQARKLFTYLIYQYPNLQVLGAKKLREALGGAKRLNSTGIFYGLNQISPKSLTELIGENHDRLLARLQAATTVRNKIFHGQLTDDYLTREDLFAYVFDLQDWCRLLSVAAEKELGYDGFDSNSYRTSKRSELADELVNKKNIDSLNAYQNFLAQIETKKLYTP